MIRVTLPTQVMSADKYSSMEYDCSCSEYRQKQFCTHTNASVGYIKNRMKIESISRNKSVTLQGIDKRQDLELVSLPALDKELISFISVFRRRFLSSKFRTTACVKVDCRTKSLNKPYRLRVSCHTYPWAIGNRMDCIHESTVIHNLNGEHRQSRRVVSEQTIQLETEFNSEEPIDVEIDNAFPMHRNVPTSDELEKHGISFPSTQPRLFLPCDSDDEALRNIIRQQMDSDNRDDSYRHGRFPSFTGQDISTSCVSCYI